MKVFVSGATGFVGSGVCSALLKDGHDVTGLTSNPEKTGLLKERGIQPVVGDMRDAELMSTQAENADVSILCAQLSFGSRFTKARLKESAEAELAHVKAIVEGSAKTNRKVIYTIGYLCFGNGPDGWADESCGFDPPGFSEGGVRSAEFLLDAVAQGNITGGVIASGFVYGPMGFFAEIVKQIRSGKFGLPGGGHFYWSPVFIDDLAQAYMSMLEGKGNGKAIIVVDDEPMKMRDIMFTIADTLQVKRPATFPKFMAKLFMGGPMVEGITTSRKCRNTLAKSELGWKPGFSNFKEGIPSVLEQLNRSS